MIRPSFVLVLLFVFPVAAPAADSRAVPAAAAQVVLSYAPVVRKAAPAVVNVYTRASTDAGAAAAVRRDPAYRRFFAPGEDRLGHSLGSGVIVDPNGTIVTNQHVVEDAGSIVIVLSDRREFPAELVRGDDRTDLAVLKINTGGELLPFLALKDSDELEVGDIVLAIGNPFGVGQTVTSGIVSALGRSVDGINDYRSFIQTDAAINPGNSGGALVSLDGRLAGINTALYSEGGGSVGIGFAIPSDLVRAVLTPSEGVGHRIVRPWLGATGHTVTAGTARRLGLSHPSGMQIENIVPLGPAAEAGIQPGDVILSIDGKPVADEDGLRFRFATLPVGATAKLGIWRGGEALDLDIRLLAPPETPPRKVTQLRAGPFQGITVANLSPALADELRTDEVAGVIVLDVPRGGPHLRLFVGDELLDLNGQAIADVGQLQSLLPRLSAPWRATVRRDGRTVHLAGS
ncbi:MAG TPA: trypsin-like peptidase domain-containing protein [Aliidongia sp.]|uniref:trypsin-like peptidase domain-containing protein n=1 Tax=Aliidongia sp. TaxID=1914230 RepID=UPI002DDCDE19|nr:trypsin-like peptidase domain-containing protein [Aliidongia sp.]HEV2676219.1 trypsin-like peptidase domain-containing protein [Aliidongia sp.]